MPCIAVAAIGLALSELFAVTTSVHTRNLRVLQDGRDTEKVLKNGRLRFEYIL